VSWVAIHSHLAPLSVASLPAVNACLNTASAIFLLAGYAFIRRGRVSRHRASMLTAFACSCLFLISYVYYHVRAGVIRFPGHGWIRPVYFTILTSHTILAIVIVPLVLITLSRALGKHFDRHRRIARWTLPLWLYVSITGVIVYFLLFRAYGSGS
jgi:putative membrane protein